MTVRSQHRDGTGPAAGDPTGRAQERTASGRSTPALLVAGSLALAVAPLLPVVRSADGAPAGAGFTAWPLLVVLALLPPAAVLALRARGSVRAAAGVVVGYAALAPGRFVLDLQLFADAGLAARPELLVPTSLAPLRPGAGAALLLAGHVLVAAAGMLALSTGRRDGENPEPAGGDAEVGTVPAGRPGLLVLVLVLGAVVAVGFLVAPFGSDNAYVLGRSAFDAPTATLTAGLLLAVLAAGAACVQATSPDPDRARGALAGVATGVLAVSAPAFAAGLFTDRLQVSWGPVAALLAAASLAACAAATGRGGDRGPGEVALPAAGRLQRIAGFSALLAGLSALAGALTPVLVPTVALAAAFGAATVPEVAAARLLGPAAVVLLGLAVAMLLLPSGRAAAARPVLGVAWVVAPMTAAAVLDTVLTAAEIADVGFGPGAWAAVGALLLAVPAGACCGLGGGVERDDVDLAALAARGADRPLLIACGVAAVLAVPAFALPVATGEGYRAGAVDLASGVTAWGLFAGLVAVLSAALLAPRCRPVRAAALLLGAGLVVLVRLAEFPLVAAGVEGGSAATGTWASLAVLVALVIAVGVALRPGTDSTLGGAVPGYSARVAGGEGRSRG